MPYLSKVIDYVNNRLKETTLNRNDIQRGRFFGLAKQVQVEGEDNILMPVIYSDGKEIDPIIDDRYSFQIYHRITSTSYGVSETVQAGDEFQFLDETTTVRALVYSNGNSVKLTENDLAYLLMVGLTMVIKEDELKNLGVNNITVLPSGADFNSRAVFAAEYGTDALFKINPEDNYFAFTYTVKMTANKNCLNCDDC